MIPYWKIIWMLKSNDDDRNYLQPSGCRITYLKKNIILMLFKFIKKKIIKKIYLKNLFKDDAIFKHL